ncbi:MAG TPA: LemA family protein [Methylomirabilota bacterium]|nr:LemA family protein [Methylomirabilota bacterium]
MAFWIIIAAVVLVVFYAVATYNGLIAKRNRVRNAWAQIDVQLKRRHDLIPNLVNTVKGYLQHEREVLENVTRARQQAIAAGSDVAARSAAESALSQAMRSLFAVAEAYPELKANQNMLALQEELGSTENKVAFARQFYNDSVLQYNTARETFPRNLFADSFGFAAEPLFALDEPAERAVPQVQF